MFLQISGKSVSQFGETLFLLGHVDVASLKRSIMHCSHSCSCHCLTEQTETNFTPSLNSHAVNTGYTQKIPFPGNSTLHETRTKPFGRGSDGYSITLCCCRGKKAELNLFKAPGLNVFFLSLIPGNRPQPIHLYLDK